jgi:predicted phage terminase large subunit-like protein
MACRSIIRSEWYQQYAMKDQWGNPIWNISDDQDQKGWYSTSKAGHRQSLTTATKVFGKKGDILIADDPHDPATVSSPAERRSVNTWYREAYYNRTLDFTTGRHIVSGARTHVDDLQEGLMKDGGWTIVKLGERFNANKVISTPWFIDTRKHDEQLRPDEITEEKERELKRTMGPQAYAAQFNQEPRNPEGRAFDRDKVRLVPDYPVGVYAVRFWDTAATKGKSSCYTSGVLMLKTVSENKSMHNRTIIADVKRGQWTPAERDEIIRNTCLNDMHRPGFISYRAHFESGAGDSGVERDANLIAFLAGIPISAVRATGSKEFRAEPFQRQWAAGNVWAVVAPWNGDYFDELESFPDAAIKDSVDASSAAFNQLFVGAPNCEPGTAEDSDTMMGTLPSGTFFGGGRRQAVY